MPKKENIESEEEKETTSDSIPVVEEKPKKRSRKKKKEEEITIMDIPGIGPAMAAKLQEADFHTLESVSVANATELSAAAEIGVTTAMKIIRAARALCGPDFKTGYELYEQRLKLKRVTTGSENLNDLLGGGLETNSVTEVYGAYRSGKTQIAHQLSVNVHLPLENGGLNEGDKNPPYVVYIDTENTFRPERIVQMCESHGLDTQTVLERVLCAKAYNSDHQMLLVQQINELITKHRIVLVVVDSVMSHFRAEYAGRGTLATRQQKLNKHLHDLQKLADANNIAVLMTNQVMSRPDAFFGDPTTYAGGHIMAHVAQTRLYLRKGKGEQRICRLVDSPNLPEGEAVFTVKGEGIRDD
ncbi:MAG: DNA repair and recombination protein RadA [Candidatus Ranarchaeia archaeon]|jgi:DNA repair protein RadA